MGLNCEIRNNCILSQDHDGALNFATDAWSSPNHKAYIAVTVHFTKDGRLVSMLLDLVEVAWSHSGSNLAAVFAKILEDFGIGDKVRILAAVCTCTSIPNSSLTHTLA
jgi:hypothetical protein